MSRATASAFLVLCLAAATVGAQEIVDGLHVTAPPLEIDVASWRLVIKGTGVPAPISLTYDELAQMPRTKAAPLLVCPGIFEDLAEWEGVSVRALLDRAGASMSWTELVVMSADGYSAVFSRADVEKRLIFLATKVNGKVLPKEHGFPARLVAADYPGGQWVKWVVSMQVR